MLRSDDTSEAITVKAAVGDQVIVRSRTVDSPVRDGEIVEVQGPDGEPPYLVRWGDGHTSLLFPGPDTQVQHVKSAPEGGR